MNNLITFCVLIFLPLFSIGQYDWKLEIDNNGIQVYSSKVPDSEYNIIKVSAVMPGNYNQLIKLLLDVNAMDKWVYKANNTKLLYSNNPLDIVYYSQTTLPWPMSKRDAVIRLQINTDSIPKFISIIGTGDPDRIEIVPGFVRLSKFNASWKVTMPAVQTLKIEYLLHVEPGGGVPVWIANIFAEKGPYETFYNLAKLLKE